MHVESFQDSSISFLNFTERDHWKTVNTAEIYEETFCSNIIGENRNKSKM